jgi:hypothetical protein
VRLVWAVILTFVAICVAVVGLTAEDAPADGPVTVSFTSVGAHSFTVPAGITSIHVVAIGGHGGSAETIGGGQGGVATADVAVTSGEVLNVNVGGNGANYAGGKPVSGGANGGGSSTLGGGGGGASDVRTGGPADLLSRLVVAAGGGGGSVPVSGGVVSTPGGDAGTDAASSSFCGGGKAGTAEHGGEGGPGSHEGESGQPGALGLGGNAPSRAGGGGGAGVFGGGAGGGDYDLMNFTGSNYCGGGGGASGFGPGTSGTSTALASSSPPSVTITFGASAAAPPPSGGGSTGRGSGSGQTGGGGQATTVGLTVARVQHGKSVIGAVRVTTDRSLLNAKLLWRASKGSKQLVFGRLVEGPLKKGLHSFTVKVNRKGTKRLEQLGKLKLTLEVRVTPPQGSVLSGGKGLALKL